jgi:hypothetical protein
VRKGRNSRVSDTHLKLGSEPFTNSDFFNPAIIKKTNIGFADYNKSRLDKQGGPHHHDQQDKNQYFTLKNFNTPARQGSIMNGTSSWMNVINTSFLDDLPSYISHKSTAQSNLQTENNRSSSIQNNRTNSIGKRFNPTTKQSLSSSFRLPLKSPAHQNSLHFGNSYSSG